ncbi:MAG: TolC family protein [Candidatus Didemnitutus sp.]|nr:TolC family protein [Candidatus Didemnitutus sp.]
MKTFRLSLLLPLLGVAASAATDLPPLPRPLTLEISLDYALAHSPTLLRTREQIREQEGVLVTASAARLPSVTAASSAARYDEHRLESPLADDRAWSVSVTASQVIYAGGSLQAQQRAQRAQLDAARLAFNAAVSDTLLGVRQQFYDVLLAREVIAVREEALKVLENELAYARSRRDAGTGSDFDLLRAEVAVANARPGLIRARNSYKIAQEKLRTTLGATSTPAGDLAVQGTLVVPARDVALADAVSAARAHRPELQQQERLVQAADQAVTGARSGYQPTVSAVGGYAWSSPSLTTTAGNLHGWSAGLQASWNIFDSKATAGKVTQARARAQQSRFALEERQLAVELEVRTAHASLVEASEVLQASEQVVTQARESLRLAQTRYQAGLSTQLDVLSAQSSLTEARSNLAQAQHDYAVALASLQRATGAPGV